MKTGKLVLERHHYKTLHGVFTALYTPWPDRNQAFRIAEEKGVSHAIAHITMSSRIIGNFSLKIPGSAD